MRRPPPGHNVTFSTQGEAFQAFVPVPLPPQPPLQWSPALRRRFDDALVALGRLDAVSSMLPNAELVLSSFVRKEAVLSSQIEGTQSSLADLMLYEIDEQPGVPLDDAHEVSRCVAAMSHGIERLRGGFPLSLRLLREMHAALLDHPRGKGKTPGAFRRSQAWLGGTRPGNAAFVPPPAHALPECLGHFERFLHDGRVEMWRGGSRSGLSVAAPFVWRCPSNLAVAPFPHPAHRTGHADLPHPALGQDLTLSPTTGCALARSGARARSARTGARVDSSLPGVA